jgi:hypothetical protein
MAKAITIQLQNCLKDLTDQIKLGRLIDELGQDFRLNDAYLRAVELLELIEGESG